MSRYSLLPVDVNVVEEWDPPSPGDDAWNPPGLPQPSFQQPMGTRKRSRASEPSKPVSPPETPKKKKVRGLRVGGRRIPLRIVKPETETWPQQVKIENEHLHRTTQLCDAVDASMKSLIFRIGNTKHTNFSPVEKQCKYLCENLPIAVVNKILQNSYMGGRFKMLLQINKSDDHEDLLKLLINYLKCEYARITYNGCPNMSDHTILASIGFGREYGTVEVLNRPIVQNCKNLVFLNLGGLTDLYTRTKHYVELVKEVKVISGSKFEVAVVGRK